jgi:inhibitor of KinA sporulation pathway (predicted exonuclease)
MERTGTHHNAIDDATSQATHLMALLTANAQVTGDSPVFMAKRPVD